MADTTHQLDLDGHRDDVLLSRWLDDELPADERSSVEARLAADPDFAARLALFERNDTLLRSAFRQGAATRVPSAVMDALSDRSESAGVTSLRRWRLPGYAMAASVLVVFGVMTQQNAGDRDGPPGMSRALAEGLETRPSRAEGWDPLANGAELRAVLTFPAADGTWCREFLLAQNESHWRGVACRHDDSWVTQVIGREVFLEQETHYRPASASAPHGAEQGSHQGAEPGAEKVARFIDEAAIDVALGPADEAALLANGWRTSD